MDIGIKHIHFQLTRNCNLRCWFCGQWGKKGFFSNSLGNDMTLEDWKRVTDELFEYSKKSNVIPTITLWGGEPLTYHYFDEIAEYVKGYGFKINLITNGVLIDKHFSSITNFIDKLYVSIDGTRRLHDSIRGEGVYNRVCENIKALNHKNVIVMSVVTEKLLDDLPQFLLELNELNINKLLLQDRIGLSETEINEYKAWLKSYFGINAVYIDSWKTSEKISFFDEYEKVMASFDMSKINFEIVKKTHINDKCRVCKNPFTHPHIAWNGNLLYCTDFYDFNAGNIKEERILNIFNNEKSKKFRKSVLEGKLPTCKHCSWRDC